VRSTYSISEYSGRYKAANGSDTRHAQCRRRNECVGNPFLIIATNATTIAQSRTRGNEINQTIRVQQRSNPLFRRLGRINLRTEKMKFVELNFPNFNCRNIGELRRLGETRERVLDIQDAGFERLNLILDRSTYHILQSVHLLINFLPPIMSNLFSTLSHALNVIIVRQLSLQ